jgi:hypothetical protein
MLAAAVARGQSVDFEAALAEGEAEAARSVAAAVAMPSLPAGQDLSWQFSDDGRSQGETGSCHAFTAVALLEAAHRRAYGHHVRLSEADLYLRRGILRHRLAFATGTEQGMTLWRDLGWGLSEGVALGADGEFPEFESRLRGFLAAAPGSALWSRERVTSALLPRADSEDARVERDAVKTAFAGFERRRVGLLSFAGAVARAEIAKEPVKCELERRVALVRRQLDLGRPVGIGLLRGFALDPAWSARAKTDGAHYFVLKGYRREGERLVFLTRNTFSPENGGSPDLDERELCMTFSLVWVLTPSEAAAERLGN